MDLRSVVRLAAIACSSTAAVMAFAAQVASRDGPPGIGALPLESQFRGAGYAIPVLGIELGSPKSQPSAKPHLFPMQVAVSRTAVIQEQAPELRTVTWTRTADGFIARLSIRSAGALGLRVGLRVQGVAPGAVEVRSATSFSDIPTYFPWGSEEASSLIWTPYTPGDTQVIELFGNFDPRSVSAVIVDASHFFIDPLSLDSAKDAKLLSCQQNYTCSTNADVMQTGPAVAKLIITEAAGSFVCSGALLNDKAASGTPWFATASHCGISNAQVAGSLQFLWFYEQACGGTAISPSYRTTVGAQLLLDDSDNDFTFLRVTGPLPSGTRFLGWNSNNLTGSEAVYGVHHPAGSPKKYSLGNFVDNEPVSFRTDDPSVVRTISGNKVNWTSGNTEGGSSGSPLLTTGSQFRGTLSAGPINPTCDAARPSYYSRFAFTYPLIRSWIDPVQLQDDFANSPSATMASQPQPYDSVTLQGTINSSTDEDWMRFQFTQAGVWLLFTSDIQGSTTNVFAQLYDSDGTTVLEQRDTDHIRSDGRNALFFNRVNGPGTGYLRLTGFGGSTGNYKVTSIYYPNDDHSDIPFLGDALAANGGSASGTIGRGGDSDYFIIDVPSSGALRVTSSGSTDLVGYLYNSAYTLVASNDDVAFPSNLNFQINTTVQPGRYYLGVLGYDVTATGAYTIASTFTPTQTSGAVTAKTLGSRATVSPTATLYGGFETSASGLVYILVRGNSLGTLGVTQSFLDAPRVRVYNGAGQDLVTDTTGKAGFNSCLSSFTLEAPVANYYQTVRNQPANGRDACVALTLTSGAYTFSVTPSIVGVTTSSGSSAPSTGEVLFEVTLGGGNGSTTKTLGSRATVSGGATHYGGFEIASAGNVYILVRGNSLGTLGVTQAFLDAPRVRIYNAQGQDMVMDTGGRAGFNTCLTSNSASAPVANYYQNVRGQAAHARDACIAQTLAPGVYTFSVTPSIPGVTTGSTQSAPAAGEVLFEVTLGP